ncbi:MAG: KOW domain-containing RNA-binding protein [Oscillospiraceae bacterium]|nr:KOW domain-containing RNA-binding protein [Oscillospiraceae bacterium]
MENAVGRIVRSAAGRDKGKFLVVVAADDEFVMVADGKERRLGNLKRKRLKHVKFTNTVIDMTDITDKKLRRLTGEWNLRACDPRN